jgi:hypothetical protein
MSEFMPLLGPMDNGLLLGYDQSSGNASFALAFDQGLGILSLLFSSLSYLSSPSLSPNSSYDRLGDTEYQVEFRLDTLCTFCFGW